MGTLFMSSYGTQKKTNWKFVSSFVDSKSEYCHHRNTPGEYMFYVENDDAQLSKTFTLILPRELY